MNTYLLIAIVVVITTIVVLFSMQQYEAYEWKDGVKSGAKHLPLHDGHKK
jgi:hypothetical protein